ncbi:MAG TPA: hypothetical protein VIR00_09220 [Micromonosporaceae bacterium]
MWRRHRRQGWLTYVLGERIDTEYYGFVLDSWSRMHARPEAMMAEAGLGRARLDDLLVRRPEITDELLAVLRETSATLSGWASLRLS